MPSFSLHVNGQTLRVDVDDPGMPLLYALRDNLNLKGPILLARSPSMPERPTSVPASRPPSCR